MATKAQLENTLRTEVLNTIIKAVIDHFGLDEQTEILAVSTSEIAIPLVDEEGNEKYAKIKVTIPRGTRNGEGGYVPYDGYEAHDEYVAEQESKAQERAVRKAMREAEKAKAKEEGE